WARSSRPRNWSRIAATSIPAGVRRPPGRPADGTRPRLRHRRAGLCRRLPAAAGAQLRRHPRPDPALLRHQPADLLQWPPGQRQAAGAEAGPGGRPGQLHRPRRRRGADRPRAAGARAAGAGAAAAKGGPAVNHLPILPILLPLVGGAAALFVEHRRYGTRIQRIVSWLFMLATLAAALALFATADGGQVLVYLLGDWPSRQGHVLMVDRLSALMVLTTALLGAACLLHACSGWDRRAPHFHALFQLQLAGLAGAFLTGDIFNLFVFFEVMLIASYGLMLSGGRGVRMSAGLHYVAFNITASTLFLVALGLVYGVFGTLNMAELSDRVAALPAANVALAKATIGLLLVVFCAKAALLPLYLWLPEAYTRAPAAVAALFAVMTKVGIYAVLRVSALMLGDGAGALAGYGWDWI